MLLAVRPPSAYRQSSLLTFNRPFGAPKKFRARKPRPRTFYFGGRVCERAADSAPKCAETPAKSPISAKGGAGNDSGMLARRKPNKTFIEQVQNDCLTLLQSLLKCRNHRDTYLAAQRCLTERLFQGGNSIAYEGSNGRSLATMADQVFQGESCHEKMPSAAAIVAGQTPRAS